MFKFIEPFHNKYVFNRRTRVLAKHLVEILPEHGRMLDIGCGDGLIDFLISQQRHGLMIEGIDVFLRKQVHIPITPFNGQTIPFKDNSFEVVMLVDVLHHTEDPKILLREAKRVACQAIVLKDHTMNGLLARTTLRFMDWVGNAHHGVALPYNYWTEQQWHDTFSELGLVVTIWKSQLNLYPVPARWWFERSLHFIAVLKKEND